jgi:hypothetical protein
MLCGRFLQEVGYEDVFNQDEISEIKDLYEKAHQDLADFDKPAVEKEEKVQEAPAADAKVSHAFSDEFERCRTRQRAWP